MDLEQYKQKVEAEEKRQTLLWKEFKKSFPKTFGKIDRLSFDVPVGWVGLLREFGQNYEKQFPKIPIAQVKQKFAHLRIYPERESLMNLSDTANADVHAFIIDTEEKALEMCEGCGSKDNVTETETETGYIQRFCPNCKPKA